jgi:hypothetical protein
VTQNGTSQLAHCAQVEQVSSAQQTSLGLANIIAYLSAEPTFHLLLTIQQRTRPVQHLRKHIIAQLHSSAQSCAQKFCHLLLPQTGSIAACLVVSELLEAAIL